MGQKDYFTLNKNKILLIVEKADYLTQDGLFKILRELKKMELVSQSLSFNSFFLKLINEGLKQFSITIRSHSKVRYLIKKEFNIYDFCNSLEINGYFPMSTSLNIQKLSDYRNNYVFITKERTLRVEFNDSSLTQESIDNAFKKSQEEQLHMIKLKDIKLLCLKQIIHQHMK